MKIWLTSSQGFLGRELLPRLSNDYDVLSTSKEEVNLLHDTSVDSFIRDNNIDFVVHNAIKGGRRTSKDSISIAYENIAMYENIVKNKHLKRIINFDSAASFDRRYDIAYAKESDLGRSVPVDFYGFSKMNVALRSLQIHNSYNLRIFNCFGPQETNDRMTKSNINNYIQNKDLVVFKNKVMDVFYIDDLYTVLKYYLENEAVPKDLNLVYKEKSTLIDVVETINQLDTKKSNIQVLQKGMDYSYTGDSTLIQSLGFSFIGLKRGIQEIYAHQLKQGLELK